ncbi:MAG: hypothetical protein QMC82_02210 [Methanolinea sp.]|nr:hypothetical protein [Methanolinea sp.]
MRYAISGAGSSGCDGMAQQKLVFNPRFASFEPDVLAFEGKAREAEVRFPAR